MSCCSSSNGTGKWPVMAMSLLVLAVVASCDNGSQSRQSTKPTVNSPTSHPTTQVQTQTESASIVSKTATANGVRLTVSMASHLPLGEEISVTCTVQNDREGETLRFIDDGEGRLYFQIEVRQASGRAVDRLVRHGTGFSHGIIVLPPDDERSQEENLGAIFRFESPGQYLLTVGFAVNSASSQPSKVQVRDIPFELRPGASN